MFKLILSNINFFLTCDKFNDYFIKYNRHYIKKNYNNERLN